MSPWGDNISLTECMIGQRNSNDYNKVISCLSLGNDKKYLKVFSCIFSFFLFFFLRAPRGGALSKDSANDTSIFNCISRDEFYSAIIKGRVELR